MTETDWLVCRDPAHYPAIAQQVTAERVAEAFVGRRPSRVVRYDLPKLAAFNFVLDDVLEGGVNASLGLDGHGKSLSFVLLGVAFFGLTSMMLVGFKAQASCAGVALTLMTMHFYMGKVHGYPGWSSHHIYILVVSVSLLALSPCGRSFSWDRYRALAQAQNPHDIPPEHGDLWPQRLIALQLAALYFWAAVDKTNWLFLSGQRLEEAFIWSFTGRALEPLISLGAILSWHSRLPHSHTISNSEDSNLWLTSLTASLTSRKRASFSPIRSSRELTRRPYSWWSSIRASNSGGEGSPGLIARTRLRSFMRLVRAARRMSSKASSGSRP